MQKIIHDELELVNGGAGQDVDREGGARIVKLHCPICCPNNPEDLVDFEIIGTNPPKCIKCGFEYLASAPKPSSGPQLLRVDRA